MFFSGALGALFVYSILQSKNEHCRHTQRQAHEQRFREQAAQQQATREGTVQEHAINQQEPKIQRPSNQILPQQTTQTEVVYVPREVIREVIVDCSCKCACKEPEKPDIPRSFWSLDKGDFVRAAGDKEARMTREKHREEVARKME